MNQIILNIKAHWLNDEPLTKFEIGLLFAYIEELEAGSEDDAGRKAWCTKHQALYDMRFSCPLCNGA